jgi:putative flippase GtrA
MPKAAKQTGSLRTWDNLRARKLATLRSRERWMMVVVGVNVLVAFPSLGYAFYTSGRTFTGLMRLAPISAILASLILLYMYVTTRSVSLRQQSPSTAVLRAAERLAVYEIAIFAAISAACLALLISVTGVLTAPANWLVARLPWLKNASVWLVKEVLGYAVSTVVGFLLNRTFRERTSRRT